MPLTPVANREADTVADYLLEYGSSETYYSTVPSVVYTTSRMAFVGMTEEQAEQRGISYRVDQMSVEEWFSVRHRGYEHAHVKTLVDETDSRLIGAHLLYPQAEEFINLFAMAIHQKMSVEQSEM